MKRPFSNKRPIGPFVQLDNSLTDTEFPVDSLRNDVSKTIESIPEWAKDSDSFVDYILDNHLDVIMELSTSTKEQSKEHTTSMCYDGDESYLTDIVEGGEKTVPTTTCKGNTVRLADLHTHPVGEDAFPSVTDVRHADGGISGIPTHFNTLVFRPKRSSDHIEGHGTCFNLYSLKARCDSHEIVTEFEDRDNVSKAQDMVRDVLIPEHGTKFELKSSDL